MNRCENSQLTTHIAPATRKPQATYTPIRHFKDSLRILSPQVLNHFQRRPIRTGRVQRQPSQLVGHANRFRVDVNQQHDSVNVGLILTGNVQREPLKAVLLFAAPLGRQFFHQKGVLVHLQAVGILEGPVERRRLLFERPHVLEAFGECHHDCCLLLSIRTILSSLSLSSQFTAARAYSIAICFQLVYSTNLLTVSNNSINNTPFDWLTCPLLSPVRDVSFFKSTSRQKGICKECQWSLFSRPKMTKFEPSTWNSERCSPSACNQQEATVLGLVSVAKAIVVPWDTMIPFMASKAGWIVCRELGTRNF